MYSDKIMVQEAEKCSKCGACAGHCPVFKELQVETYSSRGKTEVAKALAEGKIPYSAYTEDLFSKCLLCLTCKANCPAGVDQSKLILGVRAELAKKRGLPFSKKMAFKYLLKNRALFGAALKAFSYLQKFSKAGGDGTLRHLPFFLSAFGQGRLIPALSGPPLRKEFPEVIPPAAGPARMRVGLFTGCFIDFAEPEIGRSLLRVLGRHGVEVVFPKKQTCCGIPVFMSGDVKDGLDLLKMNIEAFEPHRVDAIVTACATCGSALKESYAALVESEGEEWKERVKAFSSKVMDISEFLKEKITLAKGERKSLTAVTYHDPCHLVRGQNVTAQPRAILRDLPGVEYREMPEAQRCCGGGGSFSFYNYDLSKQISRKKVENIEATGASVVVTGCPGCMLQMKDQLGQKGSAAKVKHLIQVVDEAGG